MKLDEIAIEASKLSEEERASLASQLLHGLEKTSLPSFILASRKWSRILGTFISAEAGPVAATLTGFPAIFSMTFDVVMSACGCFATTGATQVWACGDFHGSGDPTANQPVEVIPIPLGRVHMMNRARPFSVSGLGAPHRSDSVWLDAWCT